MISETAICELFSSRLPSGRLNACFESDAEIISLAGEQCLFTMDEFSAEDLFREADPFLLGWNIAAGAVSDVFACGGSPRFYAHALTVCPEWDRTYLERMSDGIRGVLLASGARFIGGDCGRSRLWRCTVSVLGACDGAPVRRRGARPGDRIYLSGRIGAGNLEAALRLDQSRAEPREALLAGANAVKTQFPVRLKESILLRQYASAAIDTSDGTWKGLNALADLNGCGYAVGDMPYSDVGARLCAQAGWPKPLLFLGECGEYELLFTVRPDLEAKLLAEAQASGCVLYCLGEMTSAGRTLREDGRLLDLSTLSAAARDYDTPQQYLQVVSGWLERRSK